MRKLLILSTLTLASLGAVANNAKPIFSCTLTNGETFSIQRVGDDYLYKKGKESFKNAVRDVLDHEESGFDNSGSGFTGVSLRFKHDNKIYGIGVSQGRGSKAPPHVEVWSDSSNGEKIYLYECNTKKKIVTKFERHLMKDIGIDLMGDVSTEY